MGRLPVLALILALCGCAARSPEVMYVPQRVEVPVPYRLPAPKELTLPYKPKQLPKFISPASSDAAVALSKDDLNHLKTILRTLHTRDQAWRAWAAEGDAK